MSANITEMISIYKLIILNIQSLLPRVQKTTEYPGTLPVTAYNSHASDKNSNHRSSSSSGKYTATVT